MLGHEDFQSTLNFLRQNSVQTEKSAGRATELIFYQLKWELKQKIGPKFFEGIEKCENCDSPAVLENFVKSVNYLHVELSKFFSLQNLESSAAAPKRAEILNCLKSILFHTINANTFRIIRIVYKRTFLSFYQLQLRGIAATVSSPCQSTQCPACEKIRMKCICWSLVEKFRQCNAQLLELDLLDRLAGDVVVQIAQNTIEEQVVSVCSSNFEFQHLPVLTEWLNNTILPWLFEVYGLTWTAQPDAKMEVEDWSVSVDQCNGEKLRRRSYDYQARRLVYHLHEILGNYLTENLFPIIIDFPDTEPAVQDLKICLERVDLRRKLTLNLRHSLERRLLHPGVNTSDILTAYVKTVKTLRSIDPSGVMMDDVCSPLRQYLRSRPDTVRCIVSFMTDGQSFSEGDPDLGPNNRDALYSDSDSDTEMNEEGWHTWRPDPIRVNQKGDGSRFSKKSADIIGMLVEVYGSRELFVREYSQLLAERLLKMTDYEVENESRYLELLKNRFGESEMHLCEVMLKDAKDSQRIDAFVKSANNSATSNVFALIISAQFWPQLKEESLEWPADLQASFEAYCRKYETLKASRTLDWKTNLGVVCLELEFKGRKCEFNVSPILACIVSLFQERSRWTLNDLCSKLKVSPSIVKRRIGWWCACGVLKPQDSDGSSYALCDSIPSRSTGAPAMTCEDEEESDALLNDEDRERQLEDYWPYITNLLKTLDSLSAERLFNMLKMFGGQKKDELTIQTVQNFLQRKVREQLVCHVSGVYKLPKK